MKSIKFVLVGLYIFMIIIPTQAYADRARCTFWTQQGDPVHYATQGYGRHWMKHERDCSPENDGTGLASPIAPSPSSPSSPAMSITVMGAGDYQSCPDNAYLVYPDFIFLGKHCRWWSGQAQRDWKGMIAR